MNEWVFTVVAKDADNADVGSALFVTEAELIASIKRLLELEDATHVEVHEGDTR